MCKRMLKIDKSLASLITRLIVGSIFIYTGWMKVSDMPTILGFFSSMHIPAFLTYIVSYGELVGGALLVLGLWTLYASLFLSIIMIVAVYLTIPLGFQMFGQPLTLLAALLSIASNGAGKYAFGSCKCCDSCRHTTTARQSESGGCKSDGASGSCNSCESCDSCGSCGCEEGKTK